VGYTVIVSVVLSVEFNDVSCYRYILSVAGGGVSMVRLFNDTAIKLKYSEKLCPIAHLLTTRKGYHCFDFYIKDK
jgi:hypothetical protein